MNKEQNLRCFNFFGYKAVSYTHLAAAAAPAAAEEHIKNVLHAACAAAKTAEIKTAKAACTTAGRAALKEKMKGDDVDAIKKATEELTKPCLLYTSRCV